MKLFQIQHTTIWALDRCIFHNWQRNLSSNEDFNNLL